VSVLTSAAHIAMTVEHLTAPLLRSRSQAPGARRSPPTHRVGAHLVGVFVADLAGPEPSRSSRNFTFGCTAERGPMKSPIIKRSVILNGHKTSVSLEQPFWVELKAIAVERKVSLHRLISEIDANRQQHNLSSALRLFVLAKYRPATAARSATRAGTL
jgi:predicted DNA-binding ribbon-helix-helix protein